MTTMMTLLDAPTEVFFCDACGHLQTASVVDIADYYASQYAILADSEEQDSLYAVVDGVKVFQVEHRCATLLSKVEIPTGARVLGFGCAKGAVIRRLYGSRPDLVPHFFDVTERYVPFWEHGAEPDQWATGTLPARWQGTFDLVTSFYVLEHVEDPVAAFRDQAALLKDGGVLYCLVPDTYANPADFICADHVQHFSESSLRRALGLAGLQVTEVDASAHISGYIVVARKADPLPAPSPPVDLRPRVDAMARYWAGFSGRVREFEAGHSGSSCVYGAGFYGRFIASCLRDLSDVSCFVDQSHYLQGTLVNGLPVLAPADIPCDVRTMYVGLNPNAARRIIESMTVWGDRIFDRFYP